MDSKIALKKLKANAKLEKLIRENAPKEKILKQSKLLDTYIEIQFKQMNKYKKRSSLVSFFPNLLYFHYSYCFYFML